MESKQIQAALAMPAGAKDEPAVQPASPEYRRKAGAAAEQFEAQFVREMFKQIRKTTREIAGEDSIFANSINGDMMDFADGAVADQLAKQRVFGVANAILRQLLPEEGGNIHLKNGGAPVASDKQNPGSLPDAQGLAAFAPPLLPLNKR